MLRGYKFYNNQGEKMDLLKVLEEKVAGLVRRIKELEAENVKLSAENVQLTAKLETMENSMLSDIKRIEELDQEKALTRMVVDDLIKDIDSLVENNGNHE